VWPLRVGALIGSAGTAPLAAVTRFGFHLGAAFQIRDDLLNLVGSEERYGKELLGDLREGKRTLMLIHLLAAAGPGERRAVVAHLAAVAEHQAAGDAGPAPGMDPGEILELMVRHGSLEFAFQFGQGVAAAAYEAFAEAFADVPASPHRDFVAAIVPYMLERSA
jgi:geranylgeranyl diphosphate synthase type II